MKEQLSEKYDELIEKNTKYIPKYLRKDYKKNNILIILLQIILIIPFFLISSMLLIASLDILGLFICFLSLFSILYFHKKQSANFTERVAFPLVKELKFVDEVDSNKGISQQIYEQANFRDFSYNRYRGEKYIRAHIDNTNIEMSKVVVKKISRDSDGDKYTYIRFNGFVVISTLSEIITDGYIHIFNDKDDSRENLFKQDEKKVNMDSVAFEKEFDVYATDPIVALEILTSDIMQRFIDKKNEIACKYEVSITKNMIIMRIFGQESIFEERCPKGKYSPTAESIKEFIIQDVELVDNVSRFINDITCDICHKFNT